MRTICSLIY